MVNRLINTSDNMGVSYFRFVPMRAARKWHNSTHFLSLIIDGDTSTSAIVRRCIGDCVLLDGREYKVRDVDENAISPESLANGVNLMIRFCQPSSISKIAELIYKRISYAYLIDDNFWLLLGDSPLERFYQDPFVRSSLERAVSGATVVFCHSEIFRQFLLKYNKNVVVLPTYFDFSCLEGAELSDCDSEIRVGVVANVSRAADLAMIVPAIQAVLDRTADSVKFEFFGYIPPELEGLPRVRYLPGHADYKTFIRMQYARNWLLGLAPLNETRFSTYKTNNKFREFGGCGTAGIYSDISIYREAVSDGRTGWLVPNDVSAWEQAILNAIRNPEETREIGRAALEVVRRSYALKSVRSEWINGLSLLIKKQKAGNISTVLSGFRIRLQFRLLRGRVFLVEARQRSLFSWLREKCGLFCATTIITVRRGDSVTTSIDAPTSGEFKWTVVLATFCERPKGRVAIRINGDGAAVSEHFYDRDYLKDGGHIPVIAELNADGRVFFQFSNETDRDIGVYLLSENGETEFSSTGRIVQGRFIA